jgi:hypothetical protein
MSSGSPVNRRVLLATVGFVAVTSLGLFNNLATLTTGATLFLSSGGFNSAQAFVTGEQCSRG